MSQSSGSATLSGKVGPALALTSLAVSNIRLLCLDFDHSVLHVEWMTNQGKLKTIDIDMILTTTLTDSIASLVHTIVASGS